MRAVAVIGFLLATAGLIGLDAGAAMAQSSTEPGKMVIRLGRSSLVASASSALNKGHAATAIRFARKALKTSLGPEDEQVAHNSLCVGYTMQQDYETALRHCDRLIGLASPSWIYYNSRANAYLQGGKIRLAIADYERATELAEKLGSRAKIKPAGETRAMRISDILRRNISLAHEREALGLEGVAVGSEN